MSQEYDPKLDDPSYEEEYDPYEGYRENEYVTIDQVPLKDDELISLSEEELDAQFAREEALKAGKIDWDTDTYTLPDFLKSDPVRAKMYETLKIQMHHSPVILDDFITRFVQSYVNSKSIEQNLEELKQIKDDDFHEDFFEDEDLFLRFVEDISPELLPNFIQSIKDGEFSDIQEITWCASQVSVTVPLTGDFFCAILNHNQSIR